MISISGFYLYQHSSELGLTKPILVLKVSTNFSEGIPMISNITFEQSKTIFFYKTTESIPDFPEIDVNVRINEFTSVPASYYASSHYEFEEEKTHTINIYFRKGSEPKEGDLLILPVRMIGKTGTILYKTTAFYVWE